MDKIALVYTGGGYGGSLPGVPARNLTAPEAKQFGGEEALLASGLYQKPKKKAAPGGSEDKAARAAEG